MQMRQTAGGELPAGQARQHHAPVGMELEASLDLPCEEREGEGAGSVVGKACEEGEVVQDAEKGCHEEGGDTWTQGGSGPAG